MTGEQYVILAYIIGLALLLGYAAIVWWSIHVMFARLRREQRASDASLAHDHSHGRLGGAS